MFQTAPFQGGQTRAIPIAVVSQSTVLSSAQMNAFTSPSYAPGLNMEVSELCLQSRGFSAFTKQNLITRQKPASPTSPHERATLLHHVLLPRHLISHSESKGIVQASLRLGFKPSITKCCTLMVASHLEGAQHVSYRL